MLWVDKYRPRTLLDKVMVHEEIAGNLKKLVSEQYCPHILFYGPPGSGKKTLIMALLKQMFGPGAEKTIRQRGAMEDMIYKGSVLRIKNCALDILSLEEDLIDDDDDDNSWELMGRDLQLKLTFLYCDLSNVISNA